jgi:methylmalonyl-CoA mutase cobalamin-binding subunit
MGIAQEHLATAVVREVLGWIRESAETGGGAPNLVVATLPNQMHEGGALLVAASAAAAGWRVTYLGANLPGLEIAAAAVRTGARAVALSLIHPDDDPGVGSHLEALRRSLPAGVTLLVGGSAAAAYRAEVESAQGQVVTELTELRGALRRLASQA